MNHRPTDMCCISTFLMNMKRLNAPFDFMIDNKLLTSRRFVRERLEKFSFEEYVDKCVGGNTDAVEESFLGRVRALCLIHGAAVEGWTDYQLLLIAGLGPNVTAASTWMFHHLLADPELLVKVRKELDEFVKESATSFFWVNSGPACRKVRRERE